MKGTGEGEKGECVGDRSSRGGDTGTAKPISKEVRVTEIWATFTNLLLD